MGVSVKERNYAAEREKRNVKYRGVFNPVTGRNYTGYNEYETQRRNRKARAESYRSYSHKRKIERLHEQSPGEYLARVLTGQLGKVNNLDELMAMAGMIPWQDFRAEYKTLNITN